MADTRAERLSDFVVGLFSPRRAALRAHWRRMDRDGDYRETVLTLLRSRGYRAAETGPNETPWRGADGSADSHLTNVDSVVSKAREAKRDDPLASGLLTHTFPNNVVGTGLRPQARAGDTKNEAMEAVYASRADEISLADDLDGPSAQRMRFEKLMEDGEYFRKIVRSSPSEPIWFETIERERVATPPGSKPRFAGNEVRFGVEKDPAGRVVGYHVRRHHPGDSLNLAAEPNAFEFVPKRMMRHVKLTSRPGQTRGVPPSAAVLQDLRDLDFLLVAALKRTQVAACLAAFITTSESVPDLLDVTAENYGYQLKQKLIPGMIFKLFPGEKVESFVPNFPIPELESFVVMLARRIGAALGVSWQTVLRDFSDSTYSSARTDLLETRPTFTVLRRKFAREDLTWEWRHVLEDQLLMGNEILLDAGVTRADLQRVEWIGDGWQWIDPLKEAQAVALKLELGLTTLRDELASLGRQDWEDVIRQGAREKALRQQAEREAGVQAEPAQPERLAALLAVRDEPEEKRRAA